ncbi:MAG: PilZ domain-containing protein [Deltaproteobacteria bacterium]|nr:PilZ domain-containing protein [Deltaproteobacteria bacterium]
MRTKARFRPGESVVLEIGFPGLPNRVLLRGVALEAKGRFPGQRFAIPEPELERCQFLEEVARAPEAASFQRRHRRFPIRIPVRFFVNDEDSYLRGDAETRDLTAGGVALSTCRTLPDGARLTLVLDAGASMSLEFEGQVTWTRREGRDALVGVRFDRSNSDDMKRLRRLIGEAKRSGRTFEGEFVHDVGVYRVAPAAQPQMPLAAQPQVLPPDTLEDDVPTDVQSAAELADGPMASVEPPNQLPHGTPSAGNPLPERGRAESDDGMLRAVIELYADEADEEERTYLTEHSMLSVEQGKSQG